MTDLLERYLQAIGQYLPAETRGDTLAELRANLLEQMDARAEELGRPLEVGDVAAILRGHGKPEAVALRYLPQRSLIGPSIFPFYVFTLRRALPLVVVVYALAQTAAIGFDQNSGNLAGRIVMAALKLVPVLLMFAAVVTLTFVLVEYVISKGGLKDTLNTWEPMELPPVKRDAVDETPKSFAKKVLELVMHCLWFAYVLWVPWHPFWLMGPGVYVFGAMNVALAPVWHGFYAMLITLLSLQLIRLQLAFFPAVQRHLQPLKFACDALGVVAIGWLAFSTAYFVPCGPAANLQTIASVNQAVGLAMRIAFVAALIGVVRDIWKYVRREKLVGQMAF